MTDNTRIWLHGLGAAAISAFATAGGAALTMPDVFNTSERGLVHIVKIVVVPTAVAVFAYLKASPMPTSVLGPGDKATLQNPVVAPDGTISADSATVTKAKP